MSEVDSSTAPCRADIVTPTGVEAVKQQIFDSFVPEHRVFGLLFAFVLFFHRLQPFDPHKTSKRAVFNGCSA